MIADRTPPFSAMLPLLTGSADDGDCKDGQHDQYGDNRHGSHAPDCPLLPGQTQVK
jgi:hypothetical protein